MKTSGLVWDTPLTFKGVLTVGIGGPVFVAVGLSLLQGAYDGWTLGEMLLTRHPPARLVSWTGQPVEFALRCVFLAALGGFFFTAGLAGLLELLLRLPPLRQRIKAGPIKARTAVVLAVAPLICFGVWLALLFLLPIYYG